MVSLRATRMVDDKSQPTSKLLARTLTKQDPLRLLKNNLVLQEEM
jgi:hypothetical protein